MNSESSNEISSSDRDQFVSYYEKESISDETLQRSLSIKEAVLRVRQRENLSIDNLDVIDIGSNAGTQSILWAKDGHTVHGIEINEELVNLSRKRIQEQALDIEFVAGTAEALPWPDQCADVCLMPELLEHVQNWELCMKEAMRVLRPNGTLYLSTTNRLCPVQEEFELPLYSWYPAPLKRYCEKLSVTTKPQWVCHAKYPAIHWFSFFQLRDYLSRYGLQAQDRFDIMEISNKPSLVRFVVAAIRKLALFRFFAHVLTPYTILIAVKNDSQQK